MSTIDALARSARDVAKILANSDHARRVAALHELADCLLAEQQAILSANALDLAAAEQKGQTGALLDRLRLTPARIEALAAAVRAIADQPDPLGDIEWQTERDDGLRLGRMRAPLGVIAMIYEARPNVTIDAAALCLKSGNAAILRGGSEAIHSNRALAALVQRAVAAQHLPDAAVQLLPSTDRQDLLHLLKQDAYVDLVIPRGGEGLIRFVAEHSRIPVIRHYKGVCHLYVDREADLERALRLLVDGKLSRPAVCNALETLLVHADIAPTFLARAGELLRARGVQWRACARALPLLPDAVPATEADWQAEYLDLILAVRIVDDLAAALAHIADFGSLHTEVIATENAVTASRFLREVDASSVMWNASSRFNDGGELGLGAEIGISTTKIHAYGAMGIESLTTRKWIVAGSGHVRHPEIWSEP